MPPFHSSENRTAASLTCRIILILTLVGNGCLVDIPSVFAKCGVIVTFILLLVLVSLITKSLDLMWITARRSGANTLGGVARLAYGFDAHWITSGFIVMYTFFLLVNSFILTRDSLAPVIRRILPTANSDLTLFWMVTILTPFYVERELHNLKYLLYAGVAGLIVFIALLALSAAYDAPRHFQHQSLFPFLDQAASTVDDVISSSATLFLTFSATFNILMVQSVLRRPTGERMDMIAKQSVWISASILFVIGLLGYYFSPAPTSDEMLQNMSEAARIVCGLTLWVSTPVLLFPCRENVLEMVETLHSDGRCPEVSDCQDEIDTWTTRSTAQNSQLWTVGEDTNLLMPIEENPDCELIENPWALYVSTFGIMAVSYFTTLIQWTPLIWSLIGPALSIGINFTLPAACNLGIQQYRVGDNFRGFSRVLLSGSIVAALVCTARVILELFHVIGNESDGSNTEALPMTP